MCCHVFVSENMNYNQCVIIYVLMRVHTETISGVFIITFNCLHRFSLKHEKAVNNPAELQGRVFVLLRYLPHVTCCAIFPRFFFFFFFCDLEQSTVQLFRELSNPASDLSRAAWPNRIVVLTLMTIPPAVAEPPVGHQEECVGVEGWRGGWAGRKTEREVTDWQRETETQMDGDREWVYAMLLVSCGITQAAARRRNTETLKCFTFGRLPLHFLLFTPPPSVNQIPLFFSFFFWIFELPRLISLNPTVYPYQSASLSLTPPAAYAPCCFSQCGGGGFRDYMAE